MSRTQLLALGASTKAVRSAGHSGRLLVDPRFRGVYAVGRPATTIQSRFMATVLSCGDGAVLSHTSLAAHAELLPYRPGDPVDVSSVSWLAPTPARVVHQLRRPLHPSHRCVLDGIPVTTLPRLIIDLAETAPRNLERALNEAHYRYDLTLAAIREAASRAPGRHAL